MSRQSRWKRILSIIILLAMVMIPLKTSAEVQPITDLEDKIQGISQEEKAVLEKLFSLSQEIDALEEEANKIKGEIDKLKIQTKDLETQITDKQKDYDRQLDVLRQVMVSYQRGGGTSYLEILLNADNLSDFLKSLNIMKDISHNVNKLLASLEDSKKLLVEQRQQLADQTILLEQKEQEQLDNLAAKGVVKKEQQDYLATLADDKTYYEGQLGNVTLMWTDCKSIFADIVKELNQIIAEGYFTEEDLNIDYGVFTIKGYLKENTFNQILTEKSSLAKTVFHFQKDQVTIEVPEKHLVLNGRFELSGESAIQYVVMSGTFYDMPLETASIEELFHNGPIYIDFKGVTGDLVNINFKIDDVWSEDSTLNFVIIPQL